MQKNKKLHKKININKRKVTKKDLRLEERTKEGQNLSKKSNRRLMIKILSGMIMINL